MAIKDNGGIKEYDSGYHRGQDEGKINYTLTQPGPMFKRWAHHLTLGAEKYGENNWTLANSEEEYSRFVDSAFRHFIQWLNHDDDEDHAAAIFFNINGAEYVRQVMDGQAEETHEEASTRRPPS